MNPDSSAIIVAEKYLQIFKFFGCYILYKYKATLNEKSNYQNSEKFIKFKVFLETKVIKMEFGYLIRKPCCFLIILLNKPMTRREIAKRTNTSSEYVFRVFNNIKQKGLLKKNREKYLLTKEGIIIAENLSNIIKILKDNGKIL